jgi:UDP:flavonoid glycosyltransferase YjiC (YdhE family)
VRVLLGCSIGGLGHLTPVVAAARALRSLGHDTLVLVPPSLSEAAADSGVAFRVGAEPPRPVIDQVWARVRAGPPEAVIGLIDRELFADACTLAMLGPAEEVFDRWRPGIVVREPCEYATAVMAHRARIPHLQVGLSLSAIEHAVIEDVSETLEPHGTGVAAAIASAPYLTSFPASLDPSPWTDTRRFRNPVPDPAPLPGWSHADDRPLVYVTFGSVLGHLPEARAVYRIALDAVAELPVCVLMTVGNATDPSSLGAIPENTHVERWVPQHDVFPHADLVVCHGGSGTTLGALAAGLPLVVCPLFADQSANGHLVRTAGAGLVVSPQHAASGGLGSLGAADIAPLRQAINAVLGEPRHRRAAERIALQIALTPTLEDRLAELIPGSPPPAG